MSHQILKNNWERNIWRSFERIHILNSALKESSWTLLYWLWITRFAQFVLEKSGPSTVRRRNFKTDVSLWKRIKCFPSTQSWRNLKKRRFHPENASNIFRPHYMLEKSFWKQRFHFENASNVFRPHYAGGIWKQRFPLKTHQMFSVHTTPEEFENGGFTVKTHQMFSVHTTPEEFENEGFTLKTHQMFSVHITPEEFENGGFTLKTHQMFSVHTMLKKFKITTTTGDFGFAFDEN